MRLKFFVLDAQSQFQGVSSATVEELWRGRTKVADLPFAIGSELRVISAICDARLRPKVIYFLRLSLWNGRVTEAARQLSYQIVTSVMSSGGEDVDRPVFEYHAAGWPKDWQQQLAVALDVPVHRLDRIALGGPLPVSDLMGTSVRKSLRFFEHVIKKH